MRAEQAARQAAVKAEDKVEVCSYPQIVTWMECYDFNKLIHVTISAGSPTSVSPFRLFPFPLVTIAQDAAYRRGRITSLSYR